MNWVCFLLLLAPFQSSDSLKQYIRDGNKALEAGQHQQALEQYKEAFRIEPKAGRVKMEGTFFEDYLPRYKIALCYEHLDLAEALTWCQKSKESLEEEVIQRKRKALADYHADIERITKAADQQRQQLASKYQMELNKANALLAEYKFDEAKAAFEALYNLDPKRPEGVVGLEKVDNDKASYIRSLVLDTRSLILDKRFDTAEGVLNRIVAIEPNHPELSTLRSRLSEARKAEKTATEKPDNALANQSPPRETKPEPAPPRKEPVVIANNTPPRKSGPNPATVRTELLATLEPYRRGDPDAALKKLEAIDLNGVDQFASYHWLHGVYLLSLHKYQNKPDQQLLNRAGEAMDRVLALQPGFTPDADLYPDFILSYYRQRVANQ